MNVVQRVLESLDVSQRELASRVEQIVGRPCKQQNVQSWKQKGYFPPDIAPAIEMLTDGDVAASEACPRLSYLDKTAAA